MVYFSIMLFFAVTFCLGLTATLFAKNSENFLERNLMRMGIGLSIFALLGLIFNILRIPLDWRIFAAVSLIGPAYYFYKNRGNIKYKLSITKYDLSILAMLLIFAVNLYVHVSGAFAYPYLEDDDSWSHAMGIKYVAVEKTVFEQTNLLHYIDPYPPAYDLLLGVIHQANDSVYFTLKFFNALIVALSTIFFFFFAKEFTGNRNKALFAAFVLAAVPAFMSHFIWALSLTVTLYFVAFYCLEMTRHDSRWWIVAGLVMVAVFTSSPTHSTYFGLFFTIYLLGKLALGRKEIVRPIMAAGLGASLSFALWWIPMILKYGFKKTLEGIGINIGIIREYGAKEAFRGTGDRIYTLSDFFIAQKQNMINNPIGIGIAVSILALIGLAFILFRIKSDLKEKSSWALISLMWFFFALYAVNGARFTLKLSPFRTWMLFAIPVSILAAQGASFLFSLSKKFAGNIGKYAVFILIIFGIFFTSAQQKIAVNTANWPPGGFWTSGEEIQGYVWLKDNLPPNTKTFTFVNNGPVIGMDKFTCHWCPDVRDYQMNKFNQTPEDTHKWLRSKNYEFLIIDGQTARKFGPNETNMKVQGMTQSGKFEPVFGNNGMLVLKLV